MAITIRPEVPDSPDVRALIDELDAYLTPLYPRESRHGYSVDRLIAESVAFFLILHDTTPVGCGGIKLFGQDYGEIKRMYVRPDFRKRGLARLMLDHLERYGKDHGVMVLRLETGIHQLAAMKLYESAGFYPVPPFGDYRNDPISRFYEKRIT